MTATKQQPIAGYRISDPSDPTIKPWLSDTPDDNGYTSEPLYAGAAPAAVAGSSDERAAVLDAARDLIELRDEYAQKTQNAMPGNEYWSERFDAKYQALAAALAAASALEAPAAGAPQGEYPHEQMDAMALARYKVAPSHASMLWSHAVVAGDGAQQLYVGREVECQNMARKFAGAFLDGAFAFHSMAAAPTAQAAPSLEAPAAPVDDRAEFEKWARQQSWIKDCQRYDDGRYGHYETEKAWATWQARAALAAAPQAPAALDELRQIAAIAACWGCDHPDDAGDTETVRRVKWAARQLRAVSLAPAAPVAVTTRAELEKLQGGAGSMATIFPADASGFPVRLYAEPAAPAVDAELLELAQSIVKFNREHGSVLAVHIDNLADLVDERAAQAAAKGEHDE